MAVAKCGGWELPAFGKEFREAGQYGVGEISSFLRNTNGLWCGWGKHVTSGVVGHWLVLVGKANTREVVLLSLVGIGTTLSP